MRPDAGKPAAGQTSFSNWQWQGAAKLRNAECRGRGVSIAVTGQGCKRLMRVSLEVVDRTGRFKR